MTPKNIKAHNYTYYVFIFEKTFDIVVWENPNVCWKGEIFEFLQEQLI